MSLMNGFLWYQTFQPVSILKFLFLSVLLLPLLLLLLLLCLYCYLLFCSCLRLDQLFKGPSRGTDTFCSSGIFYRPDVLPVVLVRLWRAVKQSLSTGITVDWVDDGGCLFVPVAAQNTGVSHRATRVFQCESVQWNRRSVKSRCYAIINHNNRNINNTNNDLYYAAANRSYL